MADTVSLDGFGSGTNLNFRVIGGESMPTITRENLIWVKTDQQITSWILSPMDPAENVKPPFPEEGTVWLKTGEVSPTEFNALKNSNAITVKPIAGQQYISGKWEDKITRIYQDGEWSCVWGDALYEPGVFHVLHLKMTDGSIDYEDDGIRIKTGTGAASKSVVALGPVKFDGFDALKIEGYVKYMDEISKDKPIYQTVYFARERTEYENAPKTMIFDFKIEEEPEHEEGDIGWEYIGIDNTIFFSNTMNGIWYVHVGLHTGKKAFEKPVEMMLYSATAQ